MKNLIILTLVFISVQLSAQPIYKGLEYGMSKKDAKTEFKTHAEQYTNVDLGNGFAWRAYQQNLIYGADGLAGVLFSPVGGGVGLSHKNTISYLEFTRAFFESKNYTVLFEPDFWQYPENFGAKYGLLLVNPDKTTVVQLYPLKTVAAGVVAYNACMKVLNYAWFMDQYETDKTLTEQKQNNTGF